MSLITGAENLARLPPYQEIFATARGAAINIFKVIDRASKIDSMDTSGQILDATKVSGKIEFKNIFFNYPSRPDVPVCSKNIFQIFLSTILLINNIKYAFSDIKWIKFKH